jgi:hypothetical protein
LALSIQSCGKPSFIEKTTFSSSKQTGFFLTGLKVIGTFNPKLWQAKFCFFEKTIFSSSKQTK